MCVILVIQAQQLNETFQWVQTRGRRGVGLQLSHVAAISQEEESSRLKTLAMLESRSMHEKMKKTINYKRVPYLIKNKCPVYKNTTIFKIIPLMTSYSVQDYILNINLVQGLYLQICNVQAQKARLSKWWTEIKQIHDQLHHIYHHSLIYVLYKPANLEVLKRHHPWAFR